MSTRGPILHHPVNGAPQETWQGFSWPAFLFTGFWPFVKGMWGHGIIVWLIAICTVGWAAPVLWFVYGFKGNEWHRDKLIKEGYLSEEQWADARDARAKPRVTTQVVVSPPSAPTDVIDKLTQLGKLRDTGVLSEDEFLAQKRALIGA